VKDMPMKIILLATCMMLLAAAGAPRSFEDAVTGMSPGGRGAADMLSLLRLLDRAVSKTDADEKTKRLMDLADRSLADFDFAEFYGNPALVPLEGGYRGAVFAGTGDGARLKIQAVNGAGVMDWSRQGNFSAEFALKKNGRTQRGMQTYSGRISIGSAFGTLSHRNMNAYLKGNLAVIDPANIAQLPVPEGAEHAALNGESRRVMRAYARAFPAFSAHMLKYFGMKSLVTARGAGAARHTQLRFQTCFNMDAIRKDYPASASFLDGMTGLFRLKVRVLNDRGHRVFDFFLDSDNTFFTFTLLTRNGLLVPADDRGEPCFGEEFDITDGRTRVFTSHTEFYTNVYGLRFCTPDIVSRHEMGETAGAGWMRNRIVSITPTRIEGRAFHVVPPWLIDLVMPENMAELINDFSSVMVNANGGEGSIMEFRWEPVRPGDIRFRYFAKTEFIDNFFVRFGLRIWKRRVLPGGATADDIRRGLVQGLAALDSDLSRLAEK